MCETLLAFYSYGFDNLWDIAGISILSDLAKFLWDFIRVLIRRDLVKFLK